MSRDANEKLIDEDLSVARKKIPQSFGKNGN